MVLIIGSGLGWVVESARIQREAIAVIKDAGGGTAYDWQMSKGKYIPGRKPRAPAWLVELIGIDYFCHVIDVRLRANSTVTDATMSHVARLSRVERLTVRGTSLTDAGMANLSGLSKLSRLELDNTHITDAGLAHLKNLTELSFLDIAGTRVTSDGLAHLTGLTKLAVLDLRFTAASDAGLAQLKGLHNLKSLYLSSTQVTDRGLAHLKGLTGLVYLNLRGTQVSDAGLVHVENLTKLSQLNVDGTQVTKNGMRSLQRALPRLDIYHPRAPDHGPQGVPAAQPGAGNAESTRARVFPAGRFLAAVRIPLAKRWVSGNLLAPRLTGGRVLHTSRSVPVGLPSASFRPLVRSATGVSGYPEATGRIRHILVRWRLRGPVQWALGSPC